MISETLKRCSSCFCAPSLSLETSSLLCIRAPLIKSQSKGQTLLVTEISPDFSFTVMPSGLIGASYYITCNESLYLQLHMSITLLINSVLFGIARGILVFMNQAQDIRKTYWNVFSLYKLKSIDFNPAPLKPPSIF